MATISIDFKKIQKIINYVINTDSPSYDDIINLLTSAGSTQEEAESWVNQFVSVMCDFLGVETNINRCFTWIKSQANLDKTSDTITEKLIGMFGALLSSTNVVTIYKNGTLYKEFAPLNIARVKFNEILITFEENKRIVSFKYRDKNYKMDFLNAPQKLKELYIAKLVLNGNTIPEDLKEYFNPNINLSDLVITLDCFNSS